MIINQDRSATDAWFHNPYFFQKTINNLSVTFRLQKIWWKIQTWQAKKVKSFLVMGSALILILGDVNHVSKDRTLPIFTQYVTSNTRVERILDLLYGNVLDAYSSTLLPLLEDEFTTWFFSNPVMCLMLKHCPLPWGQWGDGEWIAVWHCRAVLKTKTKILTLFFMTYRVYI